MPIHKDHLVGKHVEFIDKHGAFRINKVIRIQGNILTTMNALKRKERVHLDKVRCWIHHGHVKDTILSGRYTKRL